MLKIYFSSTILKNDITFYCTLHTLKMANYGAKFNLYHIQFFNRFNHKIKTVKSCTLDCHFKLNMKETGYMCTHLGYIFSCQKKNRIPRVFILKRHIEYSLLLFPNDIKLNICIGVIFCKISNEMSKNDISCI